MEATSTVPRSREMGEPQLNCHIALGHRFGDSRLGRWRRPANASSRGYSASVAHAASARGVPRLAHGRVLLHNFV